MKIEYITFIYFLIFYYIFELLRFILTSAFFFQLFIQELYN